MIHILLFFLVAYLLAGFVTAIYAMRGPGPGYGPLIPLVIMVIWPVVVKEIVFDGSNYD